MTSRKKKEERPPISDRFAPGVVKITCGCDEDQRRRCLQRPGRFGSHITKAEQVQSDHCHVFVNEIDLIHLAHDVIRARFMSDQPDARPARLVAIAALRGIVHDEDVDKEEQLAAQELLNKLEST